MKNFKIVMILVAAVAFFCSCTEKTVDVTLTEANETLTYDLASAATLPLSFSSTINAAAGIKTIEVSKTVLNGEDVVSSKIYDGFESSDYEGMAEYTVKFEDTLAKADLVAGYTVEYKVAAVDKKDNSGDKIYTITITESATSLSAWNPTKVVLCSQSQSTYGITYEGIAAVVENETIGVKCDGKNDHKAYNMYAEPTTGASWVFVENIEGLTTDVALVEAFNNGTPVTSRTMFPATDQGKAYEEKYFICKNKNGEYVLVDYVAGLMNTQTGNVMVFQYKKAETPAPAAK
ncbi:MAG: hypothetical protein II575_07400 [Bacteroidales bacterium]|nr:hypothetical protein [Bacteroidales bacterium]